MHHEDSKCHAMLLSDKHNRINNGGIHMGFQSGGRGSPCGAAREFMVEGLGRQTCSPKVVGSIPDLPGWWGSN